MKIPDLQSHGWMFLADHDDINGTRYFWHKCSGMIIRIWSGSDGQISLKLPKCTSIKTIYPDTDMMPSDHDAQIMEYSRKFDKGEGRPVDFRAGKFGTWEVPMTWNLDQALYPLNFVLSGFPFRRLHCLQAVSSSREFLCSCTLHKERVGISRPRRQCGHCEWRWKRGENFSKGCDSQALQ